LKPISLRLLDVFAKGFPNKRNLRFVILVIMSMLGRDLTDKAMFPSSPNIFPPGAAEGNTDIIIQPLVN
jgi:hypothetical protein